MTIQIDLPPELAAKLASGEVKGGRLVLSVGTDARVRLGPAKEEGTWLASSEVAA